MFRIRLAVEESQSVRGLLALDIRRGLNLPDSVHLSFSDKYTCNVEVPESFAREHFGEQDLLLSVEIPVRGLMPDDVQIDDKDALMIRPDLSSERAMDLFAAHYAKEDASCSG